MAANAPSGGQGEVGNVALSWLQLYLNNDPCYCPLLIDELLDEPEAASSYTTNLDCQTVAQVDIEQQSIQVKNIYPNPARNYITIENNFEYPMPYEVLSLSGKSLLRGMIQSSIGQINTSVLDANVYILNINDQHFKFVKIN